MEAVSLEKLKLTSSEKKSALPKDIEDIDAKDKNCPLLLSIYIKDIYNYLRSLEVKYPVKKGYLENQVCIQYLFINLFINEHIIELAFTYYE